MPEWMPRLLNRIAVTHGATYEEAVRNGEEVIRLLIEDAEARGEALPPTRMIEYENDTAASATA